MNSAAPPPAFDSGLRTSVSEETVPPRFMSHCLLPSLSKLRQAQNAFNLLPSHHLQPVVPALAGQQ